MKTVFFGFLIFVQTFFVAQNLDSLLVACYPLNGNGAEPISGLTATLSDIVPAGNRFNVLNSAASFSCDSNSFIQLPNSSLLKPQQISFSAWINPTLGFTARAF